MNKSSFLLIVVVLLAGGSTLSAAQESEKEDSVPIEEAEETDAVEPAISDTMVELAELLQAGMCALGVTQESEKEQGAPVEEAEETGAVESTVSDIMVELAELLQAGMCALGAAQESEKEDAAPVEEIEETGAVEPAMSDIMTELVELRAEVLKLQQTFDSTMNTVVDELLEENRRLRRELRDAYGKGNLVLPATPIPGDELRNTVLEKGDAEQGPATWESSTKEDEGGEASSPESEDSRASEARPVLYYDVVSEWGRTPEEAAAEGDDVTSLKGMICAVRPGVSDANLAALGRLLRNRFDAYDNINIEVFDNIEAAQRYGTDRSGVAGHRLLSVSKHPASGRDVILLIKGDKAIPVPRETDVLPTD